MRWRNFAMRSIAREPPNLFGRTFIPTPTEKSRRIPRRPCLPSSTSRPYITSGKTGRRWRKRRDFPSTEFQPRSWRPQRAPLFAEIPFSEAQTTGISFPGELFISRLGFDCSRRLFVIFKVAVCINLKHAEFLWKFSLVHSRSKKLVDTDPEIKLVTT